MNRLRIMEAFVALADGGSFTAAARALGVAAGTLSRQISELEEHLGVRLVERTTRAMSLTPAGLRYCVSCREVLRAAEEADDDARIEAGSTTGRLRVAAPTLVAPMMATSVARYHEHFPEVDVHLQFEDQLTDLVRDNIDLAIRIGRSPDSTLVQRRLAPVEYVFIASPAYLDSLSFSIRAPDDLRKTKWISYSLVANPRRFDVRKEGRSFHVEVSGRTHVDTAHGLLSLLLSGLGVSVLPEMFVREHIAAGSLVRLLEDHHLESSSVFAVRSSDLKMTARVRGFMTALQDVMGPRATEPEPMEPAS